MTMNKDRALTAPRIHPVIHHVQSDETLAQAKSALDWGADGVFLISHEDQDNALLPLCRQLANEWQGRHTSAGKAPLLGLNLLTYSACEALEAAAAHGANAAWITDAGVSSRGIAPLGQQLMQTMARHPHITVFGCVAFKGEAPEPQPADAARIAHACGMRATTSGPGTGQAPDVEKIGAMGAAVNRQLAIASGMTAANVQAFTPWLSDILVATGITHDGRVIDEALFKAFAQRVRSAQAPQHT